MSVPTSQLDHKWFGRQELAHRQALLTAWFAAIASGRQDVCWSTLGQRLEYVQEMAGLTAEAWRLAAKVPKATLSSYLSGERVQVAHEPKGKTLEHMLALMRAAGQPVDLPWVMGGSQPWMAEDGYWARARWALTAAVGGGGWETLANRTKLRRPHLEPRTGTAPYAPPADAEAYAGQIAAQVVGGWVSQTWIVTGMPETPKPIADLASDLRRSQLEPAHGLTDVELLKRNHALLAVLRAEGKGSPGTSEGDKPWRRPTEINRVKVQPDANAKQQADDAPVTMEWTLRLLLPLLKLVQGHLNELPEDQRYKILNKLSAPFAARLSAAPLLTGEDKAGALTQQAIRDQRVGIVVAMAKKDAERLATYWEWPSKTKK